MRVWVGIKDLRKLIGIFLFLGLIGVGKIEFVRVLVEVLFDFENNMIRIDMIEYMEKYLVLCLIGVLLGYVGYEEGG